MMNVVQTSRIRLDAVAVDIEMVRPADRVSTHCFLQPRCPTTLGKKFCSRCRYYY